MFNIAPNNIPFFIFCALFGCLFNIQSGLSEALETVNSVNPERIYGELRSRHITALSSELPAKIEKITLREGFKFKQGAILVKLDCALIRAKHERIKSNLIIAKRKYTVEKRLLELNSTGEIDVLNAESEIQKVQADMKAGNVRLSKCIIRAPFSGRILERKMGEHR